MAFAAGAGRGKVRSDINITPLVDVVLVLLIIFMVMTPILLKQIGIQVPEKADAEDSAPDAEQIVLSISADGKLSMNREDLTREALEPRLREVFASRKDKTIFFDVDERANYGFVVEVMSACRASGAKVLGITTKT
jgi:biopolymer transport protein ExbD